MLFQNNRFVPQLENLESRLAMSNISSPVNFEATKSPEIIQVNITRPLTYGARHPDATGKIIFLPDSAFQSDAARPDSNRIPQLSNVPYVNRLFRNVINNPQSLAVIQGTNSVVESGAAAIPNDRSGESAAPTANSQSIT